MSDKHQDHSYDELLSKTFDVLRFPLIVGVVFIHSLSTTADSIIPATAEWEFPVYHYMGNFFSQVLGRVAVPLFFFMSGYLFFYKVKNFDSSTYLHKLKRRCRSLLIPYLFWNLLCAALFVGATMLPQTRSFLNHEYSFSLNFDSLVQIFIGRGDEYEIYPMAYQFWFIRDLICCVIISPLIYYFVGKTKLWGVAMLGLMWFTDYSIPYIGSRGFSSAALFFFSVGAWFSMRAVNIVYLVKDLKVIMIVYPLWIVFDLVTRGSGIYGIIIHKIGILLGIVFCFVVVALMLRKGHIKPVPFLSAASFFVFATYDPWLLTPINKLLVRYIQPTTDLGYCGVYAIQVVSTIAFAVLIYRILQKLTPTVLACITGGRGK